MHPPFSQKTFHLTINNVQFLTIFKRGFFVCHRDWLTQVGRISLWEWPMLIPARTQEQGVFGRVLGMQTLEALSHADLTRPVLTDRLSLKDRNISQRTSIFSWSRSIVSTDMNLFVELTFQSKFRRYKPDTLPRLSLLHSCTIRIILA